MNKIKCDMCNKNDDRVRIGICSAGMNSDGTCGGFIRKQKSTTKEETMNVELSIKESLLVEYAIMEAIGINNVTNEETDTLIYIVKRIAKIRKEYYNEIL
jgi:hypothetical protein